MMEESSEVGIDKDRRVERIDDGSPKSSPLSAITSTKIKKKLQTLILVRNKSNQILMGFKKRGFGQGKWEVFGGKVEPGETLEEGATRELYEECGLKAQSLKKVARIVHRFEGDPTVILDNRIFTTSDYSGEPIETEEMRPKWYNIQDIPFDATWPDMQTWFPWYLKEKTFKAYFLYQRYDKILRYTFEQTDESDATQI